MGISGSEEEPKFVLSLGDNFYADGILSVDNYRWIASYEEMFPDESMIVPWYSVLGSPCQILFCTSFPKNYDRSMCQSYTQGIMIITTTI